MSEPDSPTRRGDLHHHHHHQQQQQLLHQSGDERDEANNSIIGKVRSRVSSIFPQQLTKWFSPSASAANVSTSNGGVGASRRRRRNEDDDDHEPRADNSDNDDDDDDVSDNSGGEDADEYSSPISAQPPSKRSRLNIETTRTNFKDSQNLVSSTPTFRGRQRMYVSLHGKQKEPAYNFGPQPKFTPTNTIRSVVTEQSSAVDSADIIEVVPERNLLNTSISSRRSLNIPSSTSSESHRNLNDFKRRSMISIRTARASGASYVPPSLSGTIVEGNDDDDNEDEEEREAVTQTINRDDEEIEVDDDDDNEESEEIAKVTSKKSKFTNGNRIGRSSSVATESGESRSSSVAQAAAPKSGLFNQSNRGLRTMSGNGLNFYSHLEGRKSLFSEKNMPGMLNNSTLSLTSLNRRQFNSSIYGSTSALSDSRLLHTSSPFYKGQTTYGGAAAYSKFNRSLNQSVRIAPTLIRPTSSLSTLSSSTNSLAQGNDQSNSTAISSTAKRILELINDFSTPLNDAKKMASNIKSPAILASRNAVGKRFSEADLASARSVRLSSVRKPYTRPAVTLNPTHNDSQKLLPPLKELQVPSMSQLLQMKKMQNCTERSRQIANTSKSALNRECEYKLPGQDDEQNNTDKNANKHVSKIKNKVTASSRVSSKNNHAEDEEAPAPPNLPNIAFPFMQSVPKIDIAVKNSTAPNQPQAPKTDFKFAPAPAAKPTNNFNFGLAKEPEKAKPSMNFNFSSGSSTSTSTSASSSSSTTTNSSEFKFSSPVSVKCTPSKTDIAPINNFKFSSPLLVGQKEAEKENTASAAAVPQLKTGSVLDALKKPIEKVASPTAKPISTLFGDQFKKPSNEWECSACMVRNKDTADKCVACTTPRAKPAAATPALPSTNSFTVKNTFGEAFKPKSDTWECDACLVRNKSEATECVACSTKKPGAGPTTTASAPKLETTDAGFKSLVAQQKASKWECDACMTRNDAERNKCVCCEQAKPGTQVVSDSVPQFSFGTSSASKFTFGFGAAAGAKKEDELKAEAVASSKTENKTGFTFGAPAKSTDSSVSSTGFSFGIKPQSDSPAITSKDVPDVVKTNTTTGFKFGVQPADSSKSDTTASTTTTTPATGFSFGLKTPAADNKSGNVTFKLPSTSTDTKKPTNSNSTVTSTSSTPASSSMFSPITSSAFGEVKKPEETKPKEIKGLVFGAPASATPAAAIKPITFNAPTEASKVPPTMTFGTPSTASSTVSTSTPSSGFVFGKPATTTSSTFSPKSPATSSGFAFGKDKTSGSSTAPSLFGSSSTPSSSTSGAASQSATPVFGSATAASTTATVSSSTTGFVFGKPATTSLFGAPAASSSTTTATSSVFGSKTAAPIFSAPAAAATSSLSTPTSTISSTGLSNANSSSSTTASPTPFVFGSGGSSLSTSNTTNKPVFGSSSGTATAAAPATTASSWPANTFTFGSAKPPEETKSNTLPAFGSPASIFGQTTPMFGSAQQQQQQQVGEVKPMVAAAPSAVPSFGAPSATSTIFGSNTSASSVGTGASSNMFGSSSSTPVFGSSMGFEGFGAPAAAASVPAAPTNSNTNPAVMPTFGSSTFSSGFGSLAAASSSGSGDGAPAPKKSDMAFNFGSAQTSTNSGFSFGAAANKPAADAVFKFSTSSTPSFNFTGSSESANSGGPFQFNAAAPTAATNNIFAPMPTPGVVGSQQAIRRKMRTGTRRTQPR